MSHLFGNFEADFQRTWRSTEEAKQAGKVKSIGVSNYQRPAIEATLKRATKIPVINQVEYGIFNAQINKFHGCVRR